MSRGRCASSSTPNAKKPQRASAISSGVRCPSGRVPLGHGVDGADQQQAQHLEVEVGPQPARARDLVEQARHERLVVVAQADHLRARPALERTPVVEHDARGVARQQVAQAGAQGEPQALAGVARARDGLAHRRQVALDAALHEREQQRVLRRVAVVEAAGQQARGLGDGAQGGALEALHAEQARRRVQDPVVVGDRRRSLGQATKKLRGRLRACQAEILIAAIKSIAALAGRPRIAAVNVNGAASAAL